MLLQTNIIFMMGRIIQIFIFSRLDQLLHKTNYSLKYIQMREPFNLIFQSTCRRPGVCSKSFISMASSSFNYFWSTLSDPLLIMRGIYRFYFYDRTPSFICLIDSKEFIRLKYNISWIKGRGPILYFYVRDRGRSNY